MKKNLRKSSRIYHDGVNIPSFAELIYELVPQICASNPSPTLTDYANAVAKLLKSKYNANIPIHLSTVKRAIDSLVQSDDMLGYGKCYYINNPYFMRHISQVELRRHNCISEPFVFKISPNTYSVSTNENLSNEFIEVLRQFLGEDCVHRILHVEDQLIVMFKEKAFQPFADDPTALKPLAEYCTSPSAQALEEVVSELYILTMKSIIASPNIDPFRKKALKDELAEYESSLQKKTAN